MQLLTGGINEKRVILKSMEDAVRINLKNEMTEIDVGYLTFYYENCGKEIEVEQHTSDCVRVLNNKDIDIILFNEEVSIIKNTVTQEDVDNYIADIQVYSASEKTTIVKATLINGFEIIESSSCVDKENYNEQIGAEICIIKSKIFEFLGFMLQDSLCKQSLPHKQPN